MEAIGNFLTELVAVDWSSLISAAIASGAGLTLVTQLLKAQWVKVPATKYPRLVSFTLSLVVGVVSAIATGLAISSITSIAVFTIVAFIVSGVAYDTVHGLVKESRNAKEADQPEEVEPLAIVDAVEVAAQQIVDGVGNWGNGKARKQRIEAAGLDFEEVQKQVRKLIAQKK